MSTVKNFTHSPYGGVSAQRGPPVPPLPTSPPQATPHPAHNPQDTYNYPPQNVPHHPTPSYAHTHPAMQSHDSHRSPYSGSPVPQAGPMQSYAPQGFTQQLHQFGGRRSPGTHGTPVGLPVMAPMPFDGPPLGNAPLSGSRRRSRRGDSGGQRLDLSNSGGRSGEFGSGKMLSGEGAHLHVSGPGIPVVAQQFRSRKGSNQRNQGRSQGPLLSNHVVHSQPTLLHHMDSQDFGSYPTSTATERDTESLVSGSSSSSVRDDLPLCENDAGCSLINDKRHQRQWSHTCRLFPCYHATVKRHAKLFRHAPGQLITTPQAPQSSMGSSSMLGTKGKHSQRATMALASVNFMHISQDAPNATKITVTTGSKSFEIAGDWTQVKLHTFKRYLHQVFGVPPVAQRLTFEGTVLDDDLAFVSACGIGEGSRIVLHSDDVDDRGLDL